MARTGHRVIAVILVGLGLLATAVVPFLVIPAVIAGACVLAVRLRTTHPIFSRAWMLAGLAAGLLAAAVVASIFAAPQLIVSAFLFLGFLAYAVTIALFARAWGRGSNHPVASWISAVSLGLVGLLCVVLMGAFGRGIALADAGQSSWLIDALLLVSALGIPTLLTVGLVALLRTRKEQHPQSVVR